MVLGAIVVDIGLNKRRLPHRGAALSVMVSCYQAGNPDLGRLTFRSWLEKEIAFMFGVDRTARVGLRRW